MIRFVFTYKTGSSITFDTQQFSTITESESYFFKFLEFEEVTFQTKDGDKHVPIKDIDQMIIQECDDSGLVKNYNEYMFNFNQRFISVKNGTNSEVNYYNFSDFMNGDANMGLFSSAAKEEDVIEQPNVDVSSSEDSTDQNIVKFPTTETVTEQSISVTSDKTVTINADELVKKESEVMADEIKPVEETPVVEGAIPEKAMNFREKFLDRENKCDAWENTIIEKMDRRITKMEEFAGILDKENMVFEDFKSEKLGQ